MKASRRRAFVDGVYKLSGCRAVAARRAAYSRRPRVRVPSALLTIPALDKPVFMQHQFMYFAGSENEPAGAAPEQEPTTQDVKEAGVPEEGGEDGESGSDAE